MLNVQKKSTTFIKTNGSGSAKTPGLSLEKQTNKQNKKKQNLNAHVGPETDKCAM